MQENALLSGKIYTPGTNVTRPPVATVAKNLISGYWFKIFSFRGNCKANKDIFIWPYCTIAARFLKYCGAPSSSCLAFVKAILNS